MWKSNRPAKGGETGALFERIVKRALELRESSRPPARAAKTTTSRTTKTKATKPKASQAQSGKKR